MNALREGYNRSAIDYAEKLVAGDAELASVLAIMGAVRIGDEAVLNRYIAQLLDVTRFRRFGIVPVLTRRIADGWMIWTMAAGLARAGVAAAALTGPF